MIKMVSVDPTGLWEDAQESTAVCVWLERLVRSLTANQRVPSSNLAWSRVELRATLFGTPSMGRDIKLLKNPMHFLKRVE